MSDPDSPARAPRIPAEGAIEDAPSGEELPPLPDGGLGGSMPAWLQQAPSRPARTPSPETVDLASLTAGLDVPAWLHNLSRRLDAGQPAQVVAKELPLAQAVVKDAPQVGEPEAVPDETASDEVTDRAVAEAEASQVPDPEAPVPALRFRVRAATETVAGPVAAEPGTTSTQAPQVERHQKGAPTPQPSRSSGATVLLVLLLIALVAFGVWYYWM